MDSQSHLVVGTPRHEFWRDFRFYVFIQALIWVKTIIFFFFFGRGLSYHGQPVVLNLPFIALPFFDGNPIFIADYAFHQLMHISIALWVFLLAKHLKEFKPFSLAKLFFVAVVLHNISYWLTRSHTSLAYSLKDFVQDYIALWMFLFFFMLLLRYFPKLQKIRIPFFEKRE